MNSLVLILKTLAIHSVRYNTFRGKWSDMPESTGLCLILGMLSFVICTTAIYVEYGVELAMAIPVVWLSAIWLYAAEEGSWRINKRLLTAAFLFTIPMGCLLIIIGKGHEIIEVLIGAYMSANMLLLKTRE